MLQNRLILTVEQLKRLQIAVQSKDNVQGLTHNYYRYPARFSPKFVREVIEIFSVPGDVILDPFVGGGTTLVEALATNRHAIGFDVSPIASFVSSTKTTLLSEIELESLELWVKAIITKSILGYDSRQTFYDEEGYLNNLPWRIKKSVEIILDQTKYLDTVNKQNFIKCIILKTAQWAIDCRKITPTPKQFRDKVLNNFLSFSKGICELNKAVQKASIANEKPLSFCINDSAEAISQYNELAVLPSKPKLLITSPPYLGVNILYHQWQLKSRKRTRTPFWIIDALDGHGSSFYTFGDYRSHEKRNYLEIAKKIFISIHSVIHDDAIVVQLVGFSDHTRFLIKYLEMMDSAGFKEATISHDKLNRIKRIWRTVPNRKWYNTTKDRTTVSKEVLLIHQKKSTI